MNRDCLEFVNNQCDVIGALHLYGIKRINGEICGLIDPTDKEIFWFPKCQLSIFHESWIDRWVELGGEIDDSEKLTTTVPT